MARNDVRPKIFAHPANRAANSSSHRNTLSNLDTSEVTAFCRAQTLPNVLQRTPYAAPIRASPFHAIATSFYAVSSKPALRNSSTASVESSSSVITTETEYDEICLSQKPKRELTVTKATSDYFGCELRFVQGSLLVIYIDKYSTVRPAVPHLSAAYRVGLNFGDEITRINNRPVSSFEGEINEVYLYLSSLADITIEIVDKAIFKSHVMTFHTTIPTTEHAKSHTSLKRQNSHLSRVQRFSGSGLEDGADECIGLSFSENGTITHVAEDGLGDIAGLTPGESIASIGDIHTLATHPRQLVQMFHRARKHSKTGSVVVTTAPAHLLRALVQQAVGIISERNLPTDLNYLLNHDWEVSGAAQTQQEQHNKRQYTAAGIQMMPVVSARRDYTAHPSRHMLNGSLSNLQTALEHQRRTTNTNSVLDV